MCVRQDEPLYHFRTVSFVDTSLIVSSPLCLTIAKSQQGHACDAWWEVELIRQQMQHRNKEVINLCVQCKCGDNITVHFAGCYVIKSMYLL